MKMLKAAFGLLFGGLLATSSAQFGPCPLLPGAGPSPRTAAAPGGQDPVVPGARPTAVVGTFDSRALLMAYVRSKQFQDYLEAQKADIDKVTARARAAGDDRLVADLDRLGPAMQLRIHRQGFGTAPVDDIVARIEDKLPAIAAKAGVDVIVSKWTVTYRSPSARFVDVTEQLAAVFDPSPATWKNIRQIVTQDPVPLDQIDEQK